MKRLVTVALLMIALALGGQPVTGQDNYGERISSLETRVAELEALLGTPVAPPATPIAAVYTITGTITLGDPDESSEEYPGIEVEENEICFNAGNYGLELGTKVIIRDGTGAIIGSAPIGPGYTIYRTGCEIPFTISGLPAVDFYSITIGPYPELIYSFAELQAMNWHVELDLSYGE